MYDIIYLAPIFLDVCAYFFVGVFVFVFVRSDNFLMFFIHAGMQKEWQKE